MEQLSSLNGDFKMSRHNQNFLQNNFNNNPLKAEYFIPLVVSDLINSGKGKVKVINSKDKWYGVTYQEDKALVKEAIERMIDEDKYKKNLWDEVNKNGK